jgi:hypothetical protein
MPELENRGPRPEFDAAWRSFLSLRDPAALRDGRATQPDGAALNNLAWLC